MSKRVEKAVEYNATWGYNCSQAVALAYADVFGLDEVTCFKAMEAFGLGMGNMMGTCGALSGAIFLTGFASSNGNIDQDPTNKSKSQTYKVAKAIMEEFIEQHGSCLCKDLKKPDSPYFTPCKKCIEDAAKLVEKHLLDKN